MGSKVTHKAQCPRCASKGEDKNKDNLGIFDDGHTYCFKCQYYTPPTSENGKYGQPPGGVNRKVYDDSWREKYIGDYHHLTDRHIRAETLERYKVKVEVDDSGKDIKHHYPYFNQDGQMCGIKTRLVQGKRFFGSGNTDKTNQLFGQHMVKAGGVALTICEGELDAMSAYEMFGNRYNFVSINNGANCIDNIKANLEFIDSFESVVLCFDDDEAGRTAAKKVAPIIGQNKCKILTLQKHKDASEYLMAGDGKLFQQEWWEAKPYTVSGVATVDDMRLALLDYRETELIPLPDSFGNLQEMTRGGLAKGELTSIIAHTSIGKTTILNELIYHFATETEEKIGCFMVEDSIDETLRKVVSVHREQNLQLLRPDELDVDGVMEDAVEIGFGNKVQLYDDGGGSIDIDEMFSKIRYFIKGLGCTVILVDPLHTAIKNLSNDNIEEVMDRFIKLCKETKACIILSTHTRKPDDGNNPHKISEYDVKGSGAIPQACHNNILFSRDKLATDDYERNSIRIRVPKLRRTGQTGEGGWAWYNSMNGRLEKGHEPISGEDNDF